MGGAQWAFNMTFGRKSISSITSKLFLMKLHTQEHIVQVFFGKKIEIEAMAVAQS